MELMRAKNFDTLLKNKSDAIELSNEIIRLYTFGMKNRYTLAYYYTLEYYETLEDLKLFDLVEIEYKRVDGDFYIKPCVCEVVKLNIFDNVIKLRHLGYVCTLGVCAVRLYSGTVGKLYTIGEKL